MSASEVSSPDGMLPPNITARSSSVIVREKLKQGGGLDPFIGGENHNPITSKTQIFCHQ